MKIKDPDIGKWVDVACRECINRSCYWPRVDPGCFTAGVGYRRRSEIDEWVCGTREIKGCPMAFDK